MPTQTSLQGSAPAAPPAFTGLYTPLVLQSIVINLAFIVNVHPSRCRVLVLPGSVLLELSVCTDEETQAEVVAEIIEEEVVQNETTATAFLQESTPVLAQEVVTQVTTVAIVTAPPSAPPPSPAPPFEGEFPYQATATITSSGSIEEQDVIAAVGRRSLQGGSAPAAPPATTGLYTPLIIQNLVTILARIVNVLPSQCRGVGGHDLPCPHHCVARLGLG